MSPCVVVGDSIAVGVGQYRPECETIAKVGISSEKYIATLLPTQRMAVDSAVISLGVNDGEGLDTLDNLRTVRARIDAPSVIWLLPGLKPEVRAMIRQVAAEHGDRLVDTRSEAGPDHLHPTGTGYRVIASETGGDDAAPEEVALAEPRLSLHHHAMHRASFRERWPRTPADRIRRLRDLRHLELAHHTGRSSAKSVQHVRSAKAERAVVHERHAHAGRHVTHGAGVKMVRAAKAPVAAATFRHKARRAIEVRCGGAHPCVARTRRLHG